MLRVNNSLIRRVRLLLLGLALIGTYYEVHDVIKYFLRLSVTAGALLIMSHMQVAVLYDEGAS